MRGSIAAALGTLGDRSVIPHLLPLLSDDRLHLFVRGSIAAALGSLGNDEAIVHELAKFLQKGEIANDIHRALWNVSRRVGVRVFMIDGAEGKKIEVVRWGDETEGVHG